MASTGSRQGWRLQSQPLPWTRCFQKELWVSVQSGGPFSLQGWVSHRGLLSVGQEPGQALPAEVVTHPLTRVLLPKPEQVQVQVEVEVFSEGVGHRCLGLGSCRHRGPICPVCWPVPCRPGVFGRGSVRSRSPLSGSLGPAPEATTAVGTGLGSGVCLKLEASARAVREEKVTHGQPCDVHI